MNTDRRRIELERGLVRQSLIHHRKREEQLERLLSDVAALACAENCKCKPCRALRHLARELEETGRG